MQTFISLVINVPFKWPRQEAKTKQQQNKTTFTATTWKKPRVLADELPSANETFLRVVTGTLR